MRYSILQIQTGESNPVYRYTDPKASSDFVEDDGFLEDIYYGWRKGDRFQWFEDTSYSGEEADYTIVFFEDHPFFNCVLLLPPKYYNYNVEDAYEPCEVVESWFLKEIRRLRQSKRKRS
jgi:hypothetical protein